MTLTLRLVRWTRSLQMNLPLWQLLLEEEYIKVGFWHSDLMIHKSIYIRKMIYCTAGWVSRWFCIIKSLLMTTALSNLYLSSPELPRQQFCQLWRRSGRCLMRSKAAQTPAIKGRQRVEQYTLKSSHRKHFSSFNVEVFVAVQLLMYKHALLFPDKWTTVPAGRHPASSE